MNDIMSVLRCGQSIGYIKGSLERAEGNRIFKWRHLIVEIRATAIRVRCRDGSAGAFAFCFLSILRSKEPVTVLW